MVYKLGQGFWWMNNNQMEVDPDDGFSGGWVSNTKTKQIYYLLNLTWLLTGHALLSPTAISVQAGDVQIFETLKKTNTNNK